MPRRRSLLAAACASLAVPSLASASNYPAKPVTLVVPSGAGGALDIAARALAQRLASALKQPFVVENRSGAAMTIGAAALAQAEPDGHQLLFVTSSLVTGALMLQKRPYDPGRDFTPISLVATSPLVLIAAPATPSADVPSFVRHIKTKGPSSFASAGNGTIGHLGAEMFRTLSGVDSVHVPYKGLAAAFPDIAAGRIDWAVDAPSSSIGQIRAGNVKGLAVSSRERLAALPNLATFREQGMDKFDGDFWFGLFGPARLPEAVVKTLELEIARFAQDPVFRASFDALGIVVDGAGPAALSLGVQRDSTRWLDTIARAKLTS